MSIELHIERLVLDEALLGGERGTQVRDAIERELAGLLARPGTIGALRGIGAVAALPPATLQPASQPYDRLGARIAVAVEHGLGITPATRAGGMHG
jgi:protein involved in polysaccharide export with SLBB domain